MNNYRRAVYKVSQTEDIKEITCQDNLRSNELMTEGVIYEVDIELGTETGQAGIEYEALNAPTRYQIIYKGEIVADSKYVGNLSTFLEFLEDGHTLPIFEYTGEGLHTFQRTSREETFSITVEEIINTNKTTGELLFDKDSAEDTKITLRVIAPSAMHLWRVYPTCVHEKIEIIPPQTHYVAPVDVITTQTYCHDLNSIPYQKYYAKAGLVVGTRLFVDVHLTRPLSSKYAFKNGRIYELFNGTITDTYPCRTQLFPQNYEWFPTEQAACNSIGTIGHIADRRTFYTLNPDFYNPGVIYEDNLGQIQAQGGFYKEFSGPLWIEWTGSSVVRQGAC